MNAIIRAEHVHVEYGTLVAVDDISFELCGGQLLGLVGPNGAGKTTLLRVLAGLLVPTSGRAFVFDHPVLGEHEIVRHHVGFAPDAPPAYEELSVLQFLQFIASAYRVGRTDAEERIDFWLEHLWLTDRRTTLVKHLSRGMRQRLTLARTFVPRPHAILLDEPLSGLDPAGRIQLRGVLSMLRQQGCAMIVSSHILADLEEVATHIAIIEHGRILRWSETEAFRHHHDQRRSYCVTSLDENSEYADIIASFDGITGLKHNGRMFTFDFHADEREIAILLRHLIERGIPVVSFQKVKATLEEAYLRSGVKQVD